MESADRGKCRRPERDEGRPFPRDRQNLRARSKYEAEFERGKSAIDDIFREFHDRKNSHRERE